MEGLDMKYIAGLVLVLLFSGCATWEGVKSDSKDAADWTKEKVNQGATYIKEKTE
jgi:PBP1b-binding outer membrane lipoprotein LpoB